MEIVLMENIRKLGKVGDVVEVKAGYARNFLIPQKKGARATKENKELLEVKRADLEKQSQLAEAKAKELAKKIQGIDLVMVRSATESGRLYGSVSAKTLADFLSEKMGEKFDSFMIQIPAPFKEIGLFSVGVNLYGDVFAQFRLVVAQSEGEAKDLVKEHQDGVKAQSDREKKEAESKQQEKVAVKELKEETDETNNGEDQKA
ncbi:MAG: 50S ribosomal protein L9 [Alphaproteobacteria bacterium]|nr:50S ribosomal protein L9 [Alphaproteobacteria bacterium]